MLFIGASLMCHHASPRSAAKLLGSFVLAVAGRMSQPLPTRTRLSAKGSLGLAAWTPPPPALEPKEGDARTHAQTHALLSLSSARSLSLTHTRTHTHTHARTHTHAHSHKAERLTLLPTTSPLSHPPPHTGKRKQAMGKKKASVRSRARALGVPASVLAPPRSASAPAAAPAAAAIPRLFASAHEPEAMRALLDALRSVERPAIPATAAAPAVSAARQALVAQIKEEIRAQAARRAATPDALPLEGAFPRLENFTCMADIVPGA